MKKKYIIICLSIFILILLDQLSKILIVRFFDLGESLTIIKNFFSFTYIRNTGAAFGMLSGGNLLMFAIITAFVLYYLIVELKKKGTGMLSMISYSLIISGALGNLIDRVLRGYVVDFFAFKLFGHEMAIFNVADICITIGVVLYIYVTIKEGINERSISRRKRQSKKN